MSERFYLWGVWGSERVRNTSKLPRLVTGTARFEPSSFWLKAPVLFLQLCLGSLCQRKLYGSQTIEFTLNPWKYFKPAANIFSKECTHSSFLWRYLLSDDWDRFAGDKTRLTYFNLMARFWHTVEKNTERTKTTVTQYFLLGNPQVLQPNSYQRSKREQELMFSLILRYTIWIVWKQDVS